MKRTILSALTAVVFFFSAASAVDLIGAVFSTAASAADLLMVGSFDTGAGETVKLPITRSGSQICTDYVSGATRKGQNLWSATISTLCVEKSQLEYVGIAVMTVEDLSLQLPVTVETDPATKVTKSCRAYISRVHQDGDELSVETDNVCVSQVNDTGIKTIPFPLIDVYRTPTSRLFSAIPSDKPVDLPNVVGEANQYAQP